jgi:neutral ceramidase
VKIGVAQGDITPFEPVWLVGFGSRERRSEDVYLPLKAGALSLAGGSDEALVVTADLIGYDLSFAAAAKMKIAAATGLLPRQIILTATHTHGGPFFYPWAMPGEMEPACAELIHERLVEIAISARHAAADGSVRCGRSTSAFGINRRNEADPIDPDVDTLWFADATGDIACLTVYGCHAVCFSDHRLGPDYPGFLCAELERETGATALFAAGCGGDVNPRIIMERGRNIDDEVVWGSTRELVEQVVQARSTATAVDCDNLRVSTDFHNLPYAGLPTRTSLERIRKGSNPLYVRWAEAMLALLDHGELPQSCPQEIQILELNPEFRLLFLGGEILSQIGLRLKRELQPATTVTCGYSNGLIGYVPNESTYDKGGYEVDGSHYYFLRPAPFTRDVEDLVVSKCLEMVRTQVTV